jgi:hypothetical protein
LEKIRNAYKALPDQATLAFSLFKTAEYIMNLKNVSDKIQELLETCIKDIIAKTI